MCEPMKRTPQDDLPYEQRMYYIIRDYRRMFYEREQVVAYVNKLKRRIEQLEEKIGLKGLKNQRITRQNIERNREIKRLKIYIDWLKEKHDKEIAELQRQINEKE